MRSAIAVVSVSATIFGAGGRECLAEVLHGLGFTTEIGTYAIKFYLNSDGFTTQFSYKDIGTFLIVFEWTCLLLKAPSAPHPVEDVNDFGCDRVFVLS